MLGGRTAATLEATAARIGARWRVVDSTDQQSLAAFFGALPRVDHLFTPGAAYRTGPMLELDDEAAASPFVTKFWGQYNAVKHAAETFTAHSSVVLMSGREQSFAQYSADTLLGRVGRESEIADAVLYLFTATYTTGSTIYPDGGYSLR